VPGSYVTVVKGLKPLIGARRLLAPVTGVRQVTFVRLALYGLRPDGTIWQRFWYWDSLPGERWESSGARVGAGYQESPPYPEAYPCNLDRDKTVLVMGRFLSAPVDGLEVNWGTWVLFGSDMTITWKSGELERWHLTWSDGRLNKFELMQTNYTLGRFYLGEDLARDANVRNVGWAFGAAGTDFDYGRPVGAGQDHVGLWSRFNAWPRTPLQPVGHEPVQEDTLALGHFLTTDTGVLRYVRWDGKPTKEQRTGIGSLPT
jgi:hypothetical protein